MAAMARKVVMIPHTVPNSPMNGVAEAVVARKGRKRCSLAPSMPIARWSARSTAGEALDLAGGLAGCAAAPEPGPRARGSRRGTCRRAAPPGLLVAAAWTSARRVAWRNSSRKRSVARVGAPELAQLEQHQVHEKTEKTARTASTSLATQPVAPNACRISFTRGFYAGGASPTKRAAAVHHQRAREQVVQRLAVLAERRRAGSRARA